MRLFTFLSFLLALFPSQLFANELVVRYFQTDARTAYQVALLEMALRNTEETDGPFKLEKKNEGVTQMRGLGMLANRMDVDIAFLAANEEREKRFLSVKVPLLQGLLGYRISLIRRSEEHSFSKVTTLDQLRQNYTAGFGAQWADMKVLQANNIRVKGVAKYTQLFSMLSKGRFQYFPRGINEIWGEIEKYKQTYPNLSVEPSFAFLYPYVVFFYVHKDNQKLADRIERGLNIAKENGEFKKLFFAYNSEALKRGRIAERRVFKLQNSTLPAHIELPDTSWWLDQNKLM